MHLIFYINIWHIYLFFLYFSENSRENALLFPVTLQVIFVVCIRLECTRCTSIRTANSLGELLAENNACMAIDTGNLNGRVQYEIDGTSLALHCAGSHAACMGLNLTDARNVKPAWWRIISATNRPRLHKAVNSHDNRRH
jgi:hypothetical protein